MCDLNHDCEVPYYFGKEQHEPCEYCGEMTCQWRIRPDLVTLKRRKTWCCWMHSVWEPEEATAARARRVLNDWNELTDPLQMHLLRLHEMPEQYPSDTRAALRAFLDSEAKAAIAPGVSLANLNSAIRSLGLDQQVYVEQRSHETVLRRVAA